MSSGSCKPAVSELLELMGECEKLDVEIHPCISGGYFTAMVWRGWDVPDPQHHARNIQMRIRALAEHYPQVVCYCFDEYSTLLYTR